MCLKIGSYDFSIKSGFTVNCTCKRSKKTAEIKVTAMVVMNTLINKLLGEKLPLIRIYNGAQAEPFDLLEHLIETVFSLLPFA